jgi:CrcB protein
MAGYVFIGGALGTMLRYFLSEAISVTAEFPTGELIALTTVNLLGAHFLGLTARLPYFQTLWCKWLWAYGFAGGFTTMSAVTLFADINGLTWEIFAMMFAGIASYGAGWHLGRRIQQRADAK